MVKTFGWVPRPCVSAGGAFGSTMLLHPHRTHGQGWASGSQDLRKPAAAPGVPGAGTFGAVLSFWFTSRGGKGSSRMFCLANAGLLGGFCEYHAATTGSTLIVRMVKAFGWVPRPAGLTQTGCSPGVPVAGTFGAVLTRLLTYVMSGCLLKSSVYMGNGWPG